MEFQDTTISGKCVALTVQKIFQTCVKFLKICNENWSHCTSKETVSGLALCKELE